MKNLLGFLSVFVVAGLIAVCTKPSDQDCIDQAAAHYTGSSLMGAGSLVLRVEDKVFYKVVINRLTGDQVGVGALCTVFYN